MAQYSGQVTLSNLTATQLPSIQALKVLLAADPSNSGTAWVGNDGDDDVSILTGFPVTTSKDVEVTLDGTLDELWAIAENNGDILCWLLTDR